MDDRRLQIFFAHALPYRFVLSVRLKRVGHERTDGVRSRLQHSLRASRDRMIAGEDYLPVSACIPVRRAIFRSFVMVP